MRKNAPKGAQPGQPEPLSGSKKLKTGTIRDKNIIPVTICNIFRVFHGAVFYFTSLAMQPLRIASFT